MPEPKRIHVVPKELQSNRETGDDLPALVCKAPPHGRMRGHRIEIDGPSEVVMREAGAAWIETTSPVRVYDRNGGTEVLVAKFE